MMIGPWLILIAYGVSHFGLWLYTARKYPHSTVFRDGRKWKWFAVLMLLPFLGPMLFLTALQNGVQPQQRPKRER